MSNEKPIVRIATTRQAETALHKMTKLVNHNFTGGRVTKPELASWILIWFAEKEIERQKERIRLDHFDKVSHLKAVITMIEDAKKAGKEPPALEELLSPVMHAPVKKKPRNTSSPSSE